MKCGTTAEKSACMLNAWRRNKRVAPLLICSCMNRMNCAPRASRRVPHRTPPPSIVATAVVYRSVRRTHDARDVHLCPPAHRSHRRERPSRASNRWQATRRRAYKAVLNKFCLRKPVKDQSKQGLPLRLCRRTVSEGLVP